MWQTAEKLIGHLSRSLAVVAGAALSMLMVLVTLNVILRRVFGNPIQGVYDYTGFLTILLIGCGLAYCSVQDGHIEVSFFVDKLRDKTRLWLEFATCVASFFILMGSSYALLMLGFSMRRSGEASVTTQTPLFGLALLLSVCFFAFALTVLLKAVIVAGKGRGA